MRIRSLALVLALGAPALAQEKPQDKPVPPLGGGGANPRLAENITKRSVDDLVKDLSGSETERTIAEGELPRRGKVAVPTTIFCLQSAGNSTEARVSAARVLRKIKDDTAVPPLLSIYKDSKAPLELRGESALALGEIGASNSVPDLIEGLADNMFKVSETARQALIQMGVDAVEPINAAYTREMQAKDGRDGIIYRSLLIMGEIGGEKARAALSTALKTTLGPRAVPVRHHASIALGIIQDKQAIEPVLEAYLVEKDFRVATAMVRTLEWLTGEHGVPPQPYRWKAWWTVNRDRVLGIVDHRDENVTLPKDGIKKGDSLEAPSGPAKKDGK